MPTPDTRTPSEHDCDRILYSDELRRLGGVTQVLAVGEAPLFHTRLTHTLKVQQLARRLAEHLYRTEVQAAGSSSIDVSAAEAAGLAHDLGHPPFGHVGEQALHQKCEAHGLDGFEGNAQTFRILTKLGSHPTLSSGLGISSKTLAAVVKYPWQRVGKHAKSSKWNAYMTESKAFEDCRVGINEGERSIEAQIMDWADDVTYAVHDLEDFARSGHVPLTTLSDLEDSDEFVSFFNRAEERLQKKSDYKDLDWSVVREDFASMLTLCFEKVKTQPLGPGRTKEIRDGCRLLISEYISGAELSGDKRSISISPKRRCEVDLFKQLTWHYVIHDPRLAVLPGDVGQSREGWLVPAGCVGPVVVVVVQPAVKFTAALGLAHVAAGVGPAVGQGAVKPLDLAVGLRPIGPRALVPDAELGAGVAPQV